MSKKFRSAGFAAAALMASLAAGAQPSPSASGGKLASAAQPTPYSSAFEGYRTFSADAVGDWRQANETVREIGGWRAYAREMHGGSAQTAGAHQGHAAPPTAPADPRQGHHR